MGRSCRKNGGECDREEVSSRLFYMCSGGLVFELVMNNHMAKQGLVQLTFAHFHSVEPVLAS